MPTRILFLASQLQPFLISGVKCLLQDFDVEILVYCQHKEENNLLDIPKDSRLHIFLFHHEPDTFFWNDIKHFKPQIVFCAGWMFRQYLSWSNALRQQGAKTICAMDTQWKGSLKQKLLVWAAPFTVQKYFTHAWVPGKRQKEYALKLGFSESQLLNHLYAPNTQLFAKACTVFKQNGNTIPSKKFLYVGRMEPHKVLHLIQAFLAINSSELNHWQLHLVGNGSLENEAYLNHPSVFYQKSVTQVQLLEIAAQNAVFCLCSIEEPWGMVAQEFAAAGMPLLISKQCGSSEHFLSENGIICDGASIESIKKGLLTFIQMDENRLKSMSEKSHQLGIQSNSETWAKELMSLV
jgi:glycosyltransferase involved in cell wall biosynthesis